SGEVVYRGNAVVARGFEPGVGTGATPGTVARTVSVVSAGTTIGRVEATVPVAALLASIAATTNTKLALTYHGVVEAGELRGRRVQGALGRPLDVRVHDRGYRVLRELVAPGLGIVALVPQRAIEATVRHRRLGTPGAGAL